MDTTSILNRLHTINNTQINNQESTITRKWITKPNQPFYFEYEGKVYRLDSDFCIFDVNPAANYALGQYYGCFSIHDSYDDQHLGYIEYHPLTEFTRVPRNVENYFRNIVFDQIIWACGCEFLVL